MATDGFPNPGLRKADRQEFESLSDGIVSTLADRRAVELGYVSTDGTSYREVERSESYLRNVQDGQHEFYRGGQS